MGLIWMPLKITRRPPQAPPLLRVISMPASGQELLPAGVMPKKLRNNRNTVRQAAKALNVQRGAGFQPAGVPSAPGIHAHMGFDAGRDAGVAGQRPAPRSALEPGSSQRVKKRGLSSAAALAALGLE